MLKFLSYVSFAIFALLGNTLCALSYTASIDGVSDPVLLQEMKKESSTLSSLEKKVPTLISLKLKATGDVDRLCTIAKNAGYLNCVITPEVHGDELAASVRFNVALGDPFSLGKLVIEWNDEDIVRDVFSDHPDWVEQRIPSPSMVPSFKQGERATGKKLQAMPFELRAALQAKAYAFCRIIDTKIVADRQGRRVDVKIIVMTGPITRFGKVTAKGAPDIKDEVFLSNVSWKKGDFYTPKLIKKTEKDLEGTGLFQSVQIDEGDSFSEDWTLPMNIFVSPAKPRTVSAGVSYTSTYGAGVSAGWEHRNINHLGRKLSAKVEVWQKMRSASLSYTVPSFLRKDQNLVYIIEHDQQHYLPFESSAVKGSVLIDRQLTRKMDGVLGVSLERLESRGIIHQQLFHLFKVPCQLRWSSANSPLDPTKGVSLSVNLTPSYQILSPCFSYLIHTSTLSGYYSVCNDSITFATRLSMGNILGASRNTIPLPDRLFGGSESALRGYRTGSVSPLNAHGQPIGGRSMETASFEMRYRTSTNLGWVAFYDVGNVFAGTLPRFVDARFLHSIGCGVRYKTPIGPLRLDIGIPLQRRSHIDPPFQIYFSIGQAF